jgi:Flp pilus assembly secretin CpaC
MAEMKQGPAAPPGMPAVPPPPSPLAQGPGAPRPGVPPPPAPAQDGDARKLLARQRLQMLMTEARALQKADRLLEARSKLLEAQGAVRDAVALGVRFGPEDEQPDGALGALSALASRRVGALLRHADDLAAQGAANPRHLEEAAHDLADARHLATAFGQDLRPIEDKTARVQQLQDVLAQGVPPVAPLPRGPVAQQETAPMPVGPRKLDGRRLLDDARRELRAGQLAQARRMAETAMEPSYGVQDEAAALIHSIDDEERNQKILVSNRNADALRDAFVARDYHQAAALLRSVNLRDLTEERRSHLREILRTPEMQAALGGGRAPGRATATDLAQAAPAPGAAPGPDGIEQYRAREQVLFEKFRNESMTVQANALQTFKAGNMVAALEMLKDYLDRLRHSQMDPEHVALLARPVDDRLQKMSMVEAQARLDTDRIQNKLALNNEARRTENERRKQEDVAALMRRYDGLFKEAKYKECLVILAQAKEMDPENPAVNYAYQLTKFKDRVKYLDKMKEENEQYFLTELDMPPGPDLDTRNPVAFDRETAERLRNRKALGQGGISFGLHDERERQIEQKLLEPTTVGFSNTPLHKVIEDLRALHNVNIVADTAALNRDGISLDAPLSLTVSGISLKSALNLLLKQAQLTYVIKDQVLLVTTEDNARGKYKQVIYPVTDLVVPVDNHAPPVVSDLTRTLEQFNQSQMAGPRGVTAYVPHGGLVQGQSVSMQDALANGGLGNSFASAPVGRPQESVTRMNAEHTIQENLVKLITTTVAPESWSEMGGKGQIQFYPLGMGLVVNQTQDIQEQVADLLAALRRLQDLEVAIEIRLVSVSESFFERMGVDFDLNIVTPTSSVEPLLTTGNFTPFPFVNRFTPAKFGPVGLTPAGTFTPDLNIPIKNSSFDFSVPPFGGYPGTLGADGGLTLGLAFLSDIQVFMLLEAAQGDRRIHTMQAPRVTVFNGQSAFISVTTFQFFLIGVNINTAADQIFFTPSTQAVPLGVTLFVTPVVTADRRFVRLSLAPTLTNLANANVPLIPVQIPVPQVFNDNFVNPQPVIFQMFFQQPTIETINVNTTVLVPDGGTVLLGGLKTMSEGRNEFGPPILSKIPYINRLFKNVAYGREGNSLMIMVTPRIIINEEEEQIFLGQLPPLPRP